MSQIIDEVKTVAWDFTQGPEKAARDFHRTNRWHVGVMALLFTFCAIGIIFMLSKILGSAMGPHIFRIFGG